MSEGDDDGLSRPDVLEGLGETEIGNTVTIVPGNFPGYGPEQLLLRVPTKGQTNSKRHEASQELTVTIAVYPNLDSATGEHHTHEPIVGRLQYGTGGGEAEVEFDIQTAKIHALDQAGSLVDDAGDVRFRYGLTVISFNAANFTLKVRTDRNLRTVAPQTGVVADGSPAGGTPAGTPGEQPITIKAWVSKGTRPAGSKVTKTIVVGPLPSLNLCTIPIPVGAQAFRIYRWDAIVQFMPAMRVNQETMNTDNLAQHDIPADQIPTIPIAPSTELLVLTNMGPNTVQATCRIEFDIVL